jgi:hypothetical protein
MSLARGTRLGPYEILSSLAAGGMGERDRAARFAPDGKSYAYSMYTTSSELYLLEGLD